MGQERDGGEAPEEDREPMAEGGDALFQEEKDDERGEKQDLGDLDRRRQQEGLRGVVLSSWNSSPCLISSQSGKAGTPQLERNSGASRIVNVTGMAYKRAPT